MRNSSQARCYHHGFRSVHAASIWLLDSWTVSFVSLAYIWCFDLRQCQLKNQVNFWVALLFRPGLCHLANPAWNELKLGLRRTVYLPPSPTLHIMSLSTNLTLASKSAQYREYGGNYRESLRERRWGYRSEPLRLPRARLAIQGPAAPCSARVITF